MSSCKESGPLFFLRQCLLRLPPEMAHWIALKSLKAAVRCGWRQHVATRPQKVMGIDFPNPLGLAAGFDKNAEYIDALAALGFGFIETGTITPRPQPGNPRPRLFRLPAERALINRMGFNNHGMEAAAKRLAQRKSKAILGINIGKNRDTPAENAVEDYLQCFQRLAPFADYIVINISSPNTPGLRDWQSPEKLVILLKRLKDAQDSLRSRISRHVPLVVKVAPDLAESDIRDMAALLLAHEIEGVIAGNTTIGREGVEGNPTAKEAGGLSGAPLREKATLTLGRLAKTLQGRIPLIGCGGILRKQDADEKFAAGASLIQIYTGLIYEGPALLPTLLEAHA